MRLELSADAQTDLRNIRRFGHRRWGDAQASQYQRKLLERMRSLARGEQSGVAADHLGPGRRRSVAGSHVIHFRIAGDVLQVLRILHASQDPGRHPG